MIREERKEKKRETKKSNFKRPPFLLISKNVIIKKRKKTKKEKKFKIKFIFIIYNNSNNSISYNKVKKKMPKKIIGIILCGGTGNRFDKNSPKQFFKINNETILQINLKVFKSNKKISDIIVVSSKKFYSQTRKLCHGFTSDIVIGGITRQLSVKNGLEYAKKFNPDYVLIHDCARPFIDDVLINNLIR